MFVADRNFSWLRNCSLIIFMVDMVRSAALLVLEGRKCGIGWGNDGCWLGKDEETRGVCSER